MRIPWQDVRYGARIMIKAPGFTLVAVLSIAPGIAVNAPVFTFVNGMLLKPMPVRNNVLLRITIVLGIRSVRAESQRMESIRKTDHATRATGSSTILA